MAPLIAMLIQSGLGILGKAVLEKGKDTIQEKLGVNIDELLQTPEGIFKLKELEIEHEQFLITSAIEGKKIELENKKLDIADVSNARDANAKIQDSQFASDLAKNTPYILDFLIVGGTLLLAYLIFFVGIPASNKEIAFAAFGSMLTLCGTVVNFHRGSSIGSKTAQSALGEIAKTLGSTK